MKTTPSQGKWKAVGSSVYCQRELIATCSLTHESGQNEANAEFLASSADRHDKLLAFSKAFDAECNRAAMNQTVVRHGVMRKLHLQVREALGRTGA